MATAQETIKQALRLLRVLDKNEEPDAADATNGLSALNGLIRRGKVHHQLQDYVVEESAELDRELPALRLHIHCATGLVVTLPSEPYDGARIDIVAAVGSLSSTPLSVDPNGKKIGGSTSAASVTANARYQFRSDAANWVAMADLAADDDLPYPEEHDEDWAFILAERLAPEQGLAVDPGVLAYVREGARDAMETLWSRYKRPFQPKHETAVRLMPSVLTQTLEDVDTL